jgi:uncharacterized protein DUF4386
MSSLMNPGRRAGLLYVLTSIVGFFAMGYVPGKLIVHTNAAATATNITASEPLFRFGIAGELIGQAAFIFVALALYDLLKGVNQRQASRQASAGRPGYAVPQSASLRNCRRRNILGAVACSSRTLVCRSRFLPRYLGVWLMLAGVAWVVLSLTGILSPQYLGKVDTVSQPAIIGEIVFMFWLLIVGAKPKALPDTASSPVIA